MTRYEPRTRHAPFESTFAQRRNNSSGPDAPFLVPPRNRRSRTLALMLVICIYTFLGTRSMIRPGRAFRLTLQFSQAILESEQLRLRSRIKGDRKVARFLHSFSPPAFRVTSTSRCSPNSSSQLSPSSLSKLRSLTAPGRFL